jgi:ATP-dependent Clp protease ATP-binding subunit ClpC
MFERFTESARRALFFARYEVSQLGATSIEPEHVLLGLTRETKGIIARILELSQVRCH